MFEKTQVHPKKDRLPVTITVSNGECHEGEIFVSRGQRVIDLLNDERQFLPVDLGAGQVTAIAKAMIVSVSGVESAEEEDPVDAAETEDPYEILRVPVNVSDAELRQAWMRRVKACHPDRLAALDLDPSIIRAARATSQRINAAYDRISRARRMAQGKAA